MIIAYYCILLHIIAYYCIFIDCPRRVQACQTYATWSALHLHLIVLYVYITVHRYVTAHTCVCVCADVALKIAAELQASGSAIVIT